MAVHRENIVVAALDTLAVNGIDLGATFEPLVLSCDIEVREFGSETSIAPIDSEMNKRAWFAETVLAEVKIGNLAVVYNLPTTNIVSSSSALTFDSEDMGLTTWTAVGKVGSEPTSAIPSTGTRIFNFSRARCVGTPTYNFSKLEATRIPVRWNFYADRTTADVGVITEVENYFMLFDTARSSAIALDGAPITQNVYTAVNQLRVALIRCIYDEATSSHTGVAIRVGKIGNTSFFATFTSEINKAAGSVTTLTLLNTTLAAGETMLVQCNGFKSGTGTVTIQIELEGLI